MKTWMMRSPKSTGEYHKTSTSSLSNSGLIPNIFFHFPASSYAYLDYYANILKNFSLYCSKTNSILQTKCNKRYHPKELFQKFTTLLTFNVIRDFCLRLRIIMIRNFSEHFSDVEKVQ